MLERLEAILVRWIYHLDGRTPARSIPLEVVLSLVAVQIAAEQIS